MKITIISLFFTILFLGSCSNSCNTEYNFLNSAINNIGESIADFDYIIIIPGAGCHGCIQEGEYFLKQNINNKKILFVLSNPTSIKILQNKIGVKVRDYPNILVNRDSDFKVPTQNSAYPCVIYLNHQAKIKKIEFQTPKTSALHDLSTKINDNL